MSGAKLLEVHGVRKELDPNLRPEQQHTMPKKRHNRKAMDRSGKSRIEKKS